MWKNELGSIMTLKENENHQISGIYGSAVEFKLNKKESADLVGSISEESADLVGYTNLHKSDKGILTTTITFCMAWKIEGGFGQGS